MLVNGVCDMEAVMTYRGYVISVDPRVPEYPFAIQRVGSRRIVRHRESVEACCRWIDDTYRAIAVKGVMIDP